MQPSRINRRRFLHGAAAVMSAPAIIPAVANAADAPGIDPDTYLRGRLYKTLKLGMVKVKGSLIDKFNAAKAAGFDAVEVGTPGLNIAEVNKAIAETGLPVDGSVISSHWNIRHTDKDPKVRATALEHLKKSLEEVRAVGGNTALLVVGHGKDGPEDEINKRALDNIAQALPTASAHGVYIAIENVWNHMHYDHGGDHNQTADKLAKFADALNSPWVGFQFDIGNHHKYGNMGDWIRQLNKRIVKLDLKGYNRAKQSWADIGEGDIDWADVRKALMEIGFTGYAAAEVGGGDMNRLKKISSQMDKVFGLA